MTEPAQPLSRRALLRAIASTHLPLPIGVDIYERDYGYHAAIRLDDNQPGQVEQWADAFGSDKPEYGGTVGATKTAKAFRACNTNVVLAGWVTEVSSYVDLDVVAVES